LNCTEKTGFLYDDIDIVQIEYTYMQFYTEDEVNLLVYNNDNGSPFSQKDPYMPMKSNL